MPDVSRRIFLKGAGVAGLSMTVAGSSQAPAAAEPRPPGIKNVIVFERFAEGFHTYRVPNLIRTGNGTLLCFAGAKTDGGGDFDRTEVVLKRSTDGGQTWGPVEPVASDPPHKVAKCPVLDRETGRIFVFAVRTAAGVTGEDIANGTVPPEDMPRPFLLHSDDDGVTWSEWRELTAEIKLPGMRNYVLGPGAGLQIRNGPYAGRLLLVGYHSYLPATDGRPAVGGVHTIYSDDHGETWTVGGAPGEYDDGIVVPSETDLAELPDGTLYFNTRDERGTATGNRAAVTSSDGGATFDGRFEIVPDLVTPILHGSVLVTKAPQDERERIVFTAPQHSSSREQLTIRSSRDNGESWTQGPLIYDGPSSYSDLMPLDGNVLGVAYENGPRAAFNSSLTYTQRISFTRVPMGALDTPLPRPMITPDASGNDHRAIVGGAPKRIAGRYGRALELAGDYVEVGMSDAVALGSGPFTVALWFRSEHRFAQRLLEAYATESGRSGLQVTVLPARIEARVATDEAAGLVRRTAELVDGAWHHVAVTRDADDAVVLYVDGEAVATHEGVPGSVSADAVAGLRFGARLDGINNPVIGALDELFAADRALTADELAATITTGSYPSDSALFHLPLDVINKT